MQTLKDSELRYRRLFEATQDGILILDAKTGMIEDVNPHLINMLGYSREEFVKKKLWEVGAFKDIEASKDAFEALQENEYIRYEDLPLKTKDGRLIQVEFVSNVYSVDNKKVIQCNIRDITEHRRIIAALQANEIKYHALVNQSPDGIFIIGLSGNIRTVNTAMCNVLEFSEEEFLSMNIWDIIPEEYLDQYRERLTKILEGESLEEAAEYAVRGKSGKIHYVEILSAPHYSGMDIIGFQGIARDITARKQGEEALRESESALQGILRSTADGILAVSKENKTLFVNERFIEMWRIPQAVLASQDDSLMLQHVLVQLSDPQGFLKKVEDLYKSDEESFDTLYFEDGRVFERLSRPLMQAAELRGRVWSFRDITERKRAEEQARFQATLLNAVGQAIIATDTAGTVTYVNRATENLYGWHAEEAEGRNILDVTIPQNSQTQAREIMAQLSQGGSWSGEFLVQHRDGRVFPVLVHDSPVFNHNGELVGIIGISSDITERIQAEEKIQQQFDHLTALRSIDRVIAANFDLKFSLSEILTHVTKELDVDAADIFILNPNSQMLEYGAERGFRTKAVRKAPVRLGESYAGRVVLKRQFVQIQNLRDEPDNLFLTTHLTGEDFVFYYGMPLITKGQVKGVLEILQRAALQPNEEWFDFLNSLAGQAAIAIENATLFESLQRSNLELAMAYDATIEGWSRALDLRDKETEGHTQRVTEMTEKLAHTFGVREAELMQIRWGALLHDIGKMGVPDGILLKPGPLTDEEWVAMKKHPAFAYEMLSPIRYLKQSLDIPFCHHEKWDGTGYPRGLKAKEIPLSARLFAVVDVYDALISDRPYRKAWRQEMALDYIRTQAGQHFDPEAAAAFLNLIATE